MPSSTFLELAVTAIISAASTREGNFSKVLTEDFSRAPHAVIMILTSGAITGSADVVFPSALKDLPSCVYQLTVGIITSSIITSFLLDGNPNPMLLFTGLGLTLFSVLIQGLAYEDEKPKKASIAVDSVDAVSVAVNEDAADHQPRNSPECLIDAAAITIPDASDDGPGLAKPKVVRHSLFAGRTWVCILLVVTALKSGWVPLSLSARLTLTPSSSFFFYVCGRVFVQPILLTIIFCLSHHPAGTQALQFSHLGCGVLSGVSLAGGYYTFWMGSESLPKSVALAIGYSCPMITLVIGWCVGEYKSLSRNSRRPW